MLFVDHILRSDALVPGFQRDGHPVFVGTADETNFLPLQAKIPGINIGGNVYAGQVPDVDRAVGIRQCGGDQGALKICHGFTFFRNGKDKGKLKEDRQNQEMYREKQR